MVIWCWLVIHTSNDRMDNREYIKIQGIVVKEDFEKNKVSFAEQFEKRHISTYYNNPVQTINDTECSYYVK